MLAPYLRHAAGYYGAKSGELSLIKTALKTVRELFGLTPVAEFGPKKLSAVREAFVQKGWSRGYVNRQIGSVTRAFKWAVAEELAPWTVYQAMKALSPYAGVTAPLRIPSPDYPQIPITLLLPCPISHRTSAPSSNCFGRPECDPPKSAR